jgi:hypothetical protein
MATIKSYTDIEQSKQLAKILPIESADMYIYKNVFFGALSCFNGTTQIGEYIKLTDKESKAYPCWSLAALMNLLPSEFTEKGKYSETTYHIDIRKYALTEDVDLYQIAYGNYKFYEEGNSSWKDMINTGEKENLIDAVFQMVIWLKENEKI